MKKILLIFLLTPSLFSAWINPECDVDTTDYDHWQLIEKYEYEWTCQMSVSERMSVWESYQAGLPHGYGLTLAGINWKESKGGRWQIGLDGTGFGIYHIDIKWFLVRMKIDDEPYIRSKWATYIVTEPWYAEQYVINFLKELDNRFKGNRYKMWQAYNGSKAYADDMRLRIRVLRTKLTVAGY